MSKSLCNHELPVVCHWRCHRPCSDILETLLMCLYQKPCIFTHVCTQLDVPKFRSPWPIFWLIWRKYQRAYVIMNCQLYVVIGVCEQSSCFQVWSQELHILHTYAPEPLVYEILGQCDFKWQSLICLLAFPICMVKHRTFILGTGIHI